MTKLGKFGLVERNGMLTQPGNVVGGKLIGRRPPHRLPFVLVKPKISLGPIHLVKPR